MMNLVRTIRWNEAIDNQTNTGAVAKATLSNRKPLSDGVERTGIFYRVISFALN